MAYTHSTISRLKKFNKKLSWRWGGNLLCLSLLLFSFAGQFLHQHQKVLGTAINIEASRIISLVNSERQKAGLESLAINDKLMTAALSKANNMLTQGYWDHYSPNQDTPWQFITQTGYVYKFAGENLAKDFYDEKQLVQAWMDSPLHKANILSDKFNETGVSVVIGNLNNENVILVVQFFASQFSDEEIALIQNHQGTIVNQNSGTTTPIIQNQTIPNAFQSSRLVAIVLAIILAVTLVVDFIKYVKSKRLTKITKKYWANFIFLLILSALFYITRTQI